MTTEKARFDFGIPRNAHQSSASGSRHGEGPPQPQPVAAPASSSFPQCEREPWPSPREWVRSTCPGHNRASVTPPYLGACTCVGAGRSPAVSCRGHLGTPAQHFRGIWSQTQGRWSFPWELALGGLPYVLGSQRRNSNSGFGGFFCFFFFLRAPNEGQWDMNSPKLPTRSFSPLSGKEFWASPSDT